MLLAGSMVKDMIPLQS